MSRRADLEARLAENPGDSDPWAAELARYRDGALARISSVELPSWLI